MKGKFLNPMSNGQRWNRTRLVSVLSFLVTSTILLMIYHWSNLRDYANATTANTNTNHFLLLEDSQSHSRISYTELKRRLDSSPRSVCGCPGNLRDALESSNVNPSSSWIESTCSDEATLKGPGQNVLSFQLFGNTSENEEFSIRYFPGLRRNLESRLEFYPDWLIRVYTNLSISSLCPFVCSDENLFLCDVTNLPAGIGNVEKTMNGRTWRFLSLGDPTVSVFSSRDLDSGLFQRDLDAMRKWEGVSSEFPLHGMRDHPLHASKVMGGLWGANNQKLGWKITKDLRNEIIQTNWRELELSDEDLLARVIYSKFRNQMLIFDSYHCENWNDSIPFPSQRKVNFEFAGFPFKTKEMTFYPLPECPVNCRPKYGQHWKFC